MLLGTKRFKDITKIPVPRGWRRGTWGMIAAAAITTGGAMYMGSQDDGGDGQGVQWSQSPEYKKQMGLFEDIQEPYMKSQQALYQDVFEPQTRALGGVLGDQLKDPYTDLMKQMQTKLGGQLDQPLSLPQDVWANMWQQARERTVGEYGKARQSATERAAASGTLGQGATDRYFQGLDIQQAKSVEDIAVDMVIKEWGEKKAAQQQSIENVGRFLPQEMQAKQYATGNLMNFMGLQPQFNIPMPQSQAYTQGQQSGGSDWVSSLLQSAPGIITAVGGMNWGGGAGGGTGMETAGSEWMSGDYSSDPYGDISWK